MLGAPRGDYLNVKSVESARKLFMKSDEIEEIIFSDLFSKINRRDKAQDRAIVITNRAIYNLKPSNLASCKRRIAIERVDSVTVSLVSDEFVVHVPEEYDYRLLGSRKMECIEALQRAHAAVYGSRFVVHDSTQIMLKSVCSTKPMMKEKKKVGGPAPVSPVSAYISSPFPSSSPSSSLAAAAPVPAAGDGGPHLLTVSVPPIPSVGVGEELVPIEEVEEEEEEEPASDDELPLHTRARSTTGWSKEHTDVTQDSFDLLKVLGRGSFGKVMLVRKKDTKAIYAMKILKKETIVARNEVEHTRAERAILEGLAHPFLVKMRYAFQTPTKLYLVLDYMRGGELFHHLKQSRRFTEDRARFYVAEIALGLGYLHRNGVIYRDLKPENILMDDDGHVRLTDFGLSKATKGSSTQTFCGTPEYLAPEVIAETGHDKGVDWWSLGILLYEMLVGLPPFYSENVNTMYTLIQTAPLRFPSILSDNSKSLLSGLICRDVRARLCSSEEDVEELKSHPFFATVDWDKLYARAIVPPFKPVIKGGADDTSQFDEEFTTEPVVDSIASSSALTNQKSGRFEGFTFVDASALAADE